MLALLALTTAAAAVYAAREHASTPYDADFDAVATETGVPGNLLRAIAKVESGMRASAVSAPNVNGTRDHGLMQINDHTLTRFGVSPTDALEPRTAIRTAARLLVEIRKELGSRFSPFTWPAAYNVGSDLKPSTIGEAYASRVLFHWMLFDIARGTQGKIA